MCIKGWEILFFEKLAYLLNGGSPVCKSLTLVFLRKDFWPDSRSRFFDFLCCGYTHQHIASFILILLNEITCFTIVDSQYLKYLILGVIDVSNKSLISCTLHNYVLRLNYPKIRTCRYCKKLILSITTLRRLIFREINFRKINFRENLSPRNMFRSSIRENKTTQNFCRGF